MQGDTLACKAPAEDVAVVGGVGDSMFLNLRSVGVRSGLRNCNRQLFRVLADRWNDDSAQRASDNWRPGASLTVALIPSNKRSKTSARRGLQVSNLTWSSPQVSSLCEKSSWDR